MVWMKLWMERTVYFLASWCLFAQISAWALDVVGGVEVHQTTPGAMSGPRPAPTIAGSGATCGSVLHTASLEHKYGHIGIEVHLQNDNQRVVELFAGTREDRAAVPFGTPLTIGVSMIPTVTEPHIRKVHKALYNNKALKLGEAFVAEGFDVTKKHIGAGTYRLEDSLLKAMGFPAGMEVGYRVYEFCVSITDMGFAQVKGDCAKYATVVEFYNPDPKLDHPEMPEMRGLPKDRNLGAQMLLFEALGIARQALVSGR
jgi:hypothetical protein